MRKNLIKPAILLIILFGFSGIHGQTLNLDQAIDISMGKNLKIQSLKLEKKIDVPADYFAIGQFLPTISAGYGMSQSNSRITTYLTDDGQVVTLPTTIYGEEIPIDSRENRNSSYNIDVRETIFNGGRNYLGLKMTKINKDIRNLNLKMEQILLRSEVTLAYCTAISARQRQELATELIQQRIRQMELAEIRFNTGSVTQRDVLLAKVELGRARNDSISTWVESKRADENLNLLMNIPVNYVNTLDDLPEVFKPIWQEKKLVELALKNREDLSSSRLLERLNQYDNLSAKSQYLPMVNASYSYSLSERSGASTPFTFNPRNRNSSVGLTFSWQLFDRFSRNLAIQQTEISKKQSIINTEDLTQQIANQVRMNLDNLNSIYNQIQVADQNVDLTTENLRFEEERYRLGSATSIELGAAQISYSQARLDKIWLESEFFIKLGNLEAATGVALREKN